MSDVSLVQAVADLRLNEERLRQDLARARQTILNAASNIERTARITIGINVDTLAARTSLRTAIDRLRADVGRITVPIQIDGDAALRELIAIQDIADPIDIPIALDATAARVQLDRFQELASIDPINIPVQADADEALTDFSTAVPQAAIPIGEAAGRQFGQSFSRAFSFVATTSAVALGGFLATALFKGFNRLTTIEDATASLTVSLGSATAAAQTLQDVLDVVTGTPFNLDQFAEAASNLIAFGVEAEKIPTYLTAIGEASASRGGRANEFAQRLAITFGQISAQGRITNEEIASLATTGVNALAILGNALNVTAIEARDLVAEGLVPAEVALDVLSEGILNGSTGIAGATQAFAGTMENLRNTLTGAIGGFGAATARFGASIIRPISETLTVGFNAASGAADNFGKAINNALGGLAESDGVQAFQEFLRTVPDQVDEFIVLLGEIGPAIAPIGAAFGALGIGQIAGFLGPLQGFATAVTGPLGLATAALSAFIAVTPELRDEVGPVLGDLATVLGTGGIGLGKAASDLAVALTPLIGKLIELAGSLVPVLSVATDLGVVLAQTLVPPIALLSDILGAFPTPVLTSLVVFFGAIKAADLTQNAFRQLGRDVGNLGAGLESLNGGYSRTSRALDAFGVSQRQVMDGVRVGAAAATGALSGVALASDDATTRITGLVGAISSVGIGLATAGLPGGAIALAGVAIGGLVGGFANAKREAELLEAQIESLAEALIEELGPAVSALTGAEIFAQSVTAVERFLEIIGEDAVEDLKALGITVNEIFTLDPANIGEFFRLLQRQEEARAINAELSATELARLAELKREYSDLGDIQVEDIILINDVLLARKQAEEDITAEIDARIEKERELSITASRQEAARIRQQVELNAERLRSAEGVTAAVLFGQQALESFDAAALSAGQSIGGISPEIQAIIDGLKEGEQATLDAEDAAALWAGRLNVIADELRDIQDIFAGINNRADILNDLAAIGPGLNQIINEAEIREAESVADQVDRQYDRVVQARDRLNTAVADFATLEQQQLERIAEAEAAGATRGAAGLRRELEREREQIAVLQREVGNEEQALADLEAQLARLSTAPVTLFQELQRQAASLNISLFDLLIRQPTPESEQAFREFVSGPVSAAITEIGRTAEEEGPAAALALANSLRDSILGEFTRQFGGTTGNELFGLIVGQYDEATVDLQAAAAIEAYKDSLVAFARQFEPIPFAINVDADTTAASTAIDALDGQTVTVNVVPRVASTPTFQNFPLLFNVPTGTQQKEGGFYPNENHIAQMVLGGMRIWAEPETKGESYIPHDPARRTRSEQILRATADLFGLDVMPRGRVAVPADQASTADVIADAVAKGVAKAEASARARLAERYDRSVNIDKIVMERRSGEDDRRFLRRMMNELAELSMR